jgi:hypothetical protein
MDLWVIAEEINMDIKEVLYLLMQAFGLLTIDSSTKVSGTESKSEEAEGTKMVPFSIFIYH